MGLIRKIGGFFDAFARDGADADASHALAAVAESEATTASDAEARAPAPPNGALKRRVAVLADLVAISKDMGRAWPEVTATVERMDWLPPPGGKDVAGMLGVADALLDAVVAAVDASLPRGGEARRLRPVLRDVRKAMGLYASHRIDHARYADPGSVAARLSADHFRTTLSEAELDHLGIEWSDASTIGAGMVEALGRTLPIDDARTRYVPKTDRGRCYLDLPVGQQVAREAAAGEPRVFQAQVDVVGLLATSVCAQYEPALRRATAEKLRYWIVENLPSLATDLRRTYADWMIDIEPRRMRSWEPVAIALVSLPRMPFAAFEDALAMRRVPKDAEQAATVVKSSLLTFVQEQYALHRRALDAIREEYVAESRIELAVEHQIALASAAHKRTETRAFAP